jgi:hypothetical protein
VFRTTSVSNRSRGKLCRTGSGAPAAVPMCRKVHVWQVFRELVVDSSAVRTDNPTSVFDELHTSMTSPAGPNALSQPRRLVPLKSSCARWTAYGRRGVTGRPHNE